LGGFGWLNALNVALNGQPRETPTILKTTLFAYNVDISDVTLLCPMLKGSCLEGKCALYVGDGCALYYLGFQARLAIRGEIEETPIEDEPSSEEVFKDLKKFFPEEEK